MSYQIVCVETLHDDQNITHVGTGYDPSQANSRWSVKEVRAALHRGERFYTVSPSTGRMADVEPYDALIRGKLVETIRSTPDAVADNNLENLRACSFR